MELKSGMKVMSKENLEVCCCWDGAVRSLVFPKNSVFTVQQVDRDAGSIYLEETPYVGYDIALFEPVEEDQGTSVVDVVGSVFIDTPFMSSEDTEKHHSTVLSEDMLRKQRGEASPEQRQKIAELRAFVRSGSGWFEDPFSNGE